MFCLRELLVHGHRVCIGTFNNVVTDIEEANRSENDQLQNHVL